MNVIEHYNSEALALLCMPDVADSRLLSTLAKNLNGMRESRIAVLLHGLDEGNLEKILRLIGRQADSNIFVNLIVLHSTLSEENDTSTVYRMQPFPNPSFIKITNLSDEHIFPTVWTDFHRKSALISPDLFPPRSLLSRDRRTGELKLFGSTDVMLKEFAHKYNISLQLARPLNQLAEIEKLETYTMLHDKVDMPRRPIILTLEEVADYELSPDSRFTEFFLLVPCSQEISIGDVYSGLRTNSIVLLGTYFMFTIVETFVVFATNWIYERRTNAPEWNFVLNLRAFAGVLGLPMYLRKYRRSVSLQQLVMFMCIFSLVFNCFFNSNFSTLLIKHPRNTQIQNFEQLRDSGLEVILEMTFKPLFEKAAENVGLYNLVPNAKFVTMKQYYNLLLTFNSSYALQSYNYIWEFLDSYQRAHSRKVLCSASAMNLTGSLLIGYKLKKNFVFREALRDFLSRAFSYGLDQHWDVKAGRKMIEMLVPLLDQRLPASNPEPSALSFEDLEWLWKLLGVCYGLASLVLIGEMHLLLVLLLLLEKP
ncbi:hypothetical protein AWZ03_001098 [Drosophila navojoa]|uniref:Ionotropic glutamate receptor C-terminal domain-containing protein n=1 Tax=Drosophila navojoa TaxID=7232 RepID=A0A484BTZ7_DRONA|nr:hypothetical protein AWZ03_001098 [Drosophila navojoa]